jgi:glucosyl-3-phosphoglycerate synthase
MDPGEWLRRRTFVGARFDADELIARKRGAGTRVSVALPARDVAGTVGEIVDAVRREWMGARPLVDQIVVIDSDSSDATACVAAAAGAEVFRAREILPGIPPEPGKGEALWKSLAVVTGDLVVWLDADLDPFDPAYVPGLLGPLLHVPEVGYVKALYRRDLHGRRDDGGRVTEICARPLINLFYPELAAFVQPLAGEAAGRCHILRRVPFFTGYAVEIGLLVDLWRLLGLPALAQVELGRRHHRHQPTAALGRMGYEIGQAVLDRLAAEGRAPVDLTAAGPYARPAPRERGFALETASVPLVRRPPLRTIAHAPGGKGRSRTGTNLVQTIPTRGGER